MRHLRLLLTCSVLALNTTYILAQKSNENVTESKPTPKELAIPASPLFDLLGVSPSQVARTSDIKDFKVDWSLKNWRVNPNLSIQSQPIWELFYNRKKLEKYQRATAIQRMFASTDVSIGTVLGDANERRIGGAVKLNIYKQQDPLLIKGVYDEIQQTFVEELLSLQKNEAIILQALDSITKPSELAKKKSELRENDIQLTSYYSRRNAAIQAQAASFAADNWNTAFVDVAFGKLYTYNTDSTGLLRNLSLNRNTGNSFWLNFGFGIGKRTLVSGLLRSTFYEEEVNFITKNDISGDETTASAIAANRLYSFGLNIRYGGPISSFFAEVLWETKSLQTPIAALNEAFIAPNGTTIITSTVKWDVVHPYIINVGGDWRLGRNVVLNYGLRCLLDKNLKTVSFTPIANIACLMR